MIGLGTSFFTFSCTNLDEELYDQVTADNFFKTEQELIAGLGAAYSSFGGLGNHSNLWSTNEFRARSVGAGAGPGARSPYVTGDKRPQGWATRDYLHNTLGWPAQTPILEIFPGTRTPTPNIRSW